MGQWWWCSPRPALHSNPFFTCLCRRNGAHLAGEDDGSIFWKGFLRGLDSGVVCALSLSQPPLAISQTPVSLLPPWADVCSMCGEQLGGGVPGLFLPASLSQPRAARWIWVRREWQPAPSPWPCLMSWDTVKFWKFGDLSWQDPDQQEPSLVEKTLSPPGGNPPGVAPCHPPAPNLGSTLAALPGNLRANDSP